MIDRLSFIVSRFYHYITLGHIMQVSIYESLAVGHVPTLIRIEEPGRFIVLVSIGKQLILVKWSC